MKSASKALAVAATMAAALAFTGSAQAATQTDTSKLESAISVGDDATGLRRHLVALQRIADRAGNDGTRSTGSQGHVDSAEYVVSQLPASYWNVDLQPFSAKIFEDVTPATLSSNPAQGAGWTEGVDYTTMSFSGSGTVVDAPIAAIGFVEPTATAGASAAGCDPATFPDLTGKVALIQRGTCDFAVKAKNAQDAHAAAVIIFNEGTIGDPDRNGLINGTAGEATTFTIPILEATYPAGRWLVDHATGGTVSLSANTLVTTLTTFNVIATSKAGRSDRQIISGAHLDSVPEGPGINDDGSGTATQIEIAQKMAELKIAPRNQVRLIWFSGEEQGLFGSTFYADQLTKAQRAKVLGMLDFDMLASPNYALEIYDGDGSEFGTAGPNGSGVIERVFQDWFDKKGLYTERIAFDGRSDYDEFTVVGIPAGGIATGAEVHKDAFEQSQWGGVVSPDLAGQYDPCYHLACDSYGIDGHHDNISDEAWNWTSDAAANAILSFAMTTSSINGTSQGSASSTKDYEWKGGKRIK